MSCLTVLSRNVNPPSALAHRKKNKKNAAENCEFWYEEPIRNIEAKV
jgi:hypothetical protein